MGLLQRIAIAVTAAASAATLVAAAEHGSGVDQAAITGDRLPKHLSDYGFFADLAKGVPAEGVIPYHLNTPLFSDYTEKHRFVWVPPGSKARYDGEAAFAFPVGSALIKTFGYGEGPDFRPIETRLLLRRAEGWVALPYVWNADRTDAVLKRAGTRVPVTFTDPSGEARSISYAVPNQNQCKECHSLAGAITPIGPKARNLNEGAQLRRWVAAGILDRVPAGAPRLARWDDARAPLDDRARAYLEINCAHCHNPQGSASNSGLYFGWKQADPVARGIGKRPVAAGRGSGGRAFAIDPGDPDNSILLYRMASTEPGIAMPELGRATVHQEAVAMLTEWIAAMPETGGDAEKPEQGWVPLFDGRTLDGWTPKITGHALGEDPLDTFIVKDRAIRVSYAKYDGFKGQFGHLHWREPVSAPFRVRFEYRFYGATLPDVEPWQHSNSGLMFLGQPPATIARDQQFPVSLEMQILGAERPQPSPSGNLCTPGTIVDIDGKPLDRHCVNSTSPVYPNGRWIKAEVEVRADGTVTHFIEGRPVLRYTRPRLDPADPDARRVIALAGGKLALSGGYLSLQSEGHPVEFRNIELKRLD